MLRVGACYSHLGWKSEIEKDLQHYEKDCFWELCDSCTVFH